MRRCTGDAAWRDASEDPAHDECGTDDLNQGDADGEQHGYGVGVVAALTPHMAASSAAVEAVLNNIVRRNPRSISTRPSASLGWFPKPL